MSRIVIIGCGVVGAAIAYELSKVPGLKITVLDKQSPAQGATGAALGVLMGVISHKIKGNAWRMRQASMQRYETLIPELEALTGRQIPFNRQGILMLLPGQESGNAEEDLADWEKLVKIRSSQGWQLEIWDAAQVKSRCPHLNCERTTAVYSPQDRQVDPVALTLAMVDAAQRNGVTFQFGVTVEGYYLDTTLNTQHLSLKIKTSLEANHEAPLLENVDWLVMAAGLGSSQFQFLRGIQGWAVPQSASNLILNSLPHESNSYQPSAETRQIVDIKPVLGQAIHLRLSRRLGNPDFQPVITGDDVHIVPCNLTKQAADYWVGATVEFPTDGMDIVPTPAKLEAVMEKAIAFCPALAEATVIKTWSGLRPRPAGRPAPIVEQLQGSNILLATGHYRNGILLAPATAQAIRQMIFDF
jgi:glycine/D-amino acid oxidase-like deaminating enzyme